MKYCKYLFSFFIIFIPLESFSQSQPFVFTIYGGLFFPSHVTFKENYKTNSDLIWGIGFNLPIQSTLYINSDISYFRANGIVDALIDSTLKLYQRFIHIGILNKQPILEKVLIRLSGGFSYVTIKQTSSSSRSAAIEVEGDKKIGYYGGIGVEQPLEEQGHISAFVDVLYDYRHSEQKELYGDYGGLRIVLGIHLFLF